MARTDRIKETKMIEWESVPWCQRFNRAIDHELVSDSNCDYMQEFNGCGNCPCQTQKEGVKPNIIRGKKRCI